MSCVHYRPINPRQVQLQSNFKYSHSCYTTTCHGSDIKNPCSEVYKNSRGDLPSPEWAMQMGRITKAHALKAMKHQNSTLATTSVEKMQVRLKLLENNNEKMHLRNQNLTMENESLMKQLEEDTIKFNNLREKIELLQNKIANERTKMADVLAKQMEKDAICLKDKCTSSINISKVDQEIQIWETCKDCQRTLEGCQRKPATIVITKSELELLERDMQTLRNAVIAREEAWDKAMEREQNCRQQLARLTAEAITAHYLCETRQDELRGVTQILADKELELKSMQKHELYLIKLIAKLHQQIKELEERNSSNINLNISAKDRRYIEAIEQHARSSKGKSKPKSKCTSDRYPHPNSGSRYGSPRENKNRKGQTSSSQDHQNQICDCNPGVIKTP